MKSERDLQYLELLSKLHKNINECCTEIINSQAILNMPKGTEHFVSDLHGEYESFSHTLKNASGVISNYIDEMFGNTLMHDEKSELATLVYYPKEKLDMLKIENILLDDWYRVNFFRLLTICKRVSSKYTRSKVRKALPKNFEYILEELIQEDSHAIHKHDYYNQIIDTIIRLDRAEPFIIAICELIQRLAVDHLHVIGDIFDRGSQADKILDYLINYHSIDIEWGNHDISWMGAASGCEALICNVIRISAKYNNLHTIEEGYGINLVPLATFAMETYRDDDCLLFLPEDAENMKKKETELVAKMHKAITILQFKLEAEIINRRPEYNMQNRNLLKNVNLEDMTVEVEGEIYPLKDRNLPTVYPGEPCALSNEERELIEKLKYSFINSIKLQEHIKFLYNKGSMYLVFNDNLLFHGSIPLLENGDYKPVEFKGRVYKGKELLDMFEKLARQARYAKIGSEEKLAGLDAMWYLWCGSNSPLFGKNKMTTFERYFVNSSDPELFKETENFYNKYRNNKEMCIKILSDFGLGQNGENSHIINGHTPIKVKKGESPVKAEGRTVVIDGGYSKAYQKVTGIAGYTLISNSQGMLVAAHEPFVSRSEAIKNSSDMVSSTIYIERYPYRKKVGDTDIGKGIKKQIEDLEYLLQAYRDGVLKEKFS